MKFLSGFVPFAVFACLAFGSRKLQRPERNSNILGNVLDRKSSSSSKRAVAELKVEVEAVLNALFDLNRVEKFCCERQGAEKEFQRSFGLRIVSSQQIMARFFVVQDATFYGAILELSLLILNKHVAKRYLANDLPDKKMYRLHLRFAVINAYFDNLEDYTGKGSLRPLRLNFFHWFFAYLYDFACEQLQEGEEEEDLSEYFRMLYLADDPNGWVGMRDLLGEYAQENGDVCMKYEVMLINWILKEKGVRALQIIYHQSPMAALLTRYKHLQEPIPFQHDPMAEWVIDRTFKDWIDLEFLIPHPSTGRLLVVPYSGFEDNLCETVNAAILKFIDIPRFALTVEEYESANNGSFEGSNKVRFPETLIKLLNKLTKDPQPFFGHGPPVSGHMERNMPDALRELLKTDIEANDIFMFHVTRVPFHSESDDYIHVKIDMVEYVEVPFAFFILDEMLDGSTKLYASCPNGDYKPMIYNLRVLNKHPSSVKRRVGFMEASREETIIKHIDSSYSS